MVGKSVAVLLPEKSRHGYIKEFLRVRDGGEPRTMEDAVPLTVLHSDGCEVPVELSNFHWWANDTGFYTAIIRDVTERNRHMAKIA